MTNNSESFADLSGNEDQDAPYDRALAIKWDLSVENALDYHISVSVDGAPNLYLGRTGNGNAGFYEWRAGQKWLSEAFENGPEFGHTYSFDVWVITNEGFDGPYSTMGSVEFLEDLSAPTEPTEVPLNTAIVTDHVGSFVDLSNGEDADSENDRNLVIRWRFDRNDVTDYHIAVKENDAPFIFLGRTDDDNAEMYEWKIGQKWLNPKFEDGPKFDHTYTFNLFLIRPGKPPIHYQVGPVKCLKEG